MRLTQRSTQMIQVFIAEYLGEGYWADYPPFEFTDDETVKAQAFVRHQMKCPGCVVRSVKHNGVEALNWELW